ncbi:MAG TPA: DUF3618 domain-containing protein [Actinomycetes bacterium]|nr:DUF3618 domain-containing protein [Actinomycetes bacterium]
MTDTASQPTPAKGDKQDKKNDVVDEALAPPSRSPEEIQADIDAAQRRLADQVDVLSERLAPQSLAEDAIASVKNVFVEPDGTPKKKPIGIAVGTVASLLLLRKIFHR